MQCIEIGSSFILFLMIVVKGTSIQDQEAAAAEAEGYDVVVDPYETIWAGIFAGNL